MESLRTPAKEQPTVISHEDSVGTRPGSAFSTVLAYVEDHLFQNLTLEIVASACGISTSYVSQLFRKHLGISFCQYLAKRRMETARQLIQSGIPLAEVSKTVGYQDYSSFYRTFRKQFGCSPARLRSGNHTA